jgi:hypothetical protein
MNVKNLSKGTRCRFKNGWEGLVDDDNVGEDSRAFMVDGFMSFRRTYPKLLLSMMAMMDGMRMSVMNEEMYNFLLTPISQTCRTTGFQCCQLCERIECCDNTNPLVDEIKKLRKEVTEKDRQIKDLLSDNKD